jgi:hypothetical protein
MTDIAGERRKLADQGLRIIRRETWGARQNYASDRACEVPARALFLHISVTKLRADEHAGMREIEAIGQARFGIGCSYNAAAFPSGHLYEAQPLTRRGAHTLNNFERSTCPAHGGSLTAPSWNNNINARALVLPQDVIDFVTDVQIDAAARWAAAQIRAGLVREGARWHGHRCVSAKDCPGDVGYARIRELQRLTDHYVAVGLAPPPTPEELMAKVPFIAVPAHQSTAYYVDGAGKRKIVSPEIRDYLRETLDVPYFTNVPSDVLNLWPTIPVTADGIGQDPAQQVLVQLAAVAGQLAVIADDVSTADNAPQIAALAAKVAALAVAESDDATAAQVAEIRELVERLHSPAGP